MQHPAVSVVVPARNAAATIEEQLDALDAQEFADAWEVVVVDNASTDTTASIVEQRRAEGPELRLVRCDRLGVNAARNAGARAARAAKILICDADDVVARGWVRHMADALDHADIVGGRLEYSRLNTPFIAATRELHQAEQDLPRYYGRVYCPGGNIGFRHEVFDSLGGFDEGLLPGADDEDFGLRATDAGFSTAFVPDAVISYRFREGLRPYARQFYRYAQGAAQLYAKHATLGALRPQTTRTKLAVARNHLRALLRIHRLLDRRGRWLYVQEIAWTAGAVVAYTRFRQAV